MAIKTEGIHYDSYTTVQRDALALPGTGLTIYNSDNSQLEVNTGAPAMPIWSPVVPIPPGGSGLQSGWISFNDVVQSTSDTYERVSAFPFPGTTVIPSLSKINALLRRNGAATSASLRIYDATNAQVIAEVTGVTTLDETVISDLGPINNLPVGEATFEIQMLRVGMGGGPRAFCAGIEIRG